MPIPQLIQACSHQSCLGNAITEYDAYLDYPVLSGDSLVICVNSASSGTAPTVTDDIGGNTYTSEVSLSDGSQVATIFRAKNITNGPRRIKVQFSGAGASFVQVHCLEYNNLTTGAAYGGVSASGSSTNPATASITPVQANDLILNFVIQDSGLPENSGGTTLFTKTANFSLVLPDLQDGQVIQTRIAPDTTAITPSMTMAPTNPWVSVAIAFPSGTAGAARNATNIAIRAHMHTTIGNGQATPTKIQIATTSEDRFLLLMYWGNPGISITSLTDTDGNTWVEWIHQPTHGNAGDASMWYTNLPVAPSDGNVVTINFAGGPENVTGSTVHVLHIVNTADLPVDKSAELDGTNTTTTTDIGVSIDPTLFPELLVYLFVHSSATTTAASNSTFFMTQTIPQPSTSYVDNNNGGSFVRNTDGNAVSNTWTSDAHVDEWIDIAIALIEKPGPPTLDQEGIQWYDDNAADGTALVAQDTNISRATQTNTRLRVLTNVKDILPKQLLLFQYCEDGDDQWRDI